MKTDETRNYLLEQTKKTDLMSRKHDKVRRALNYFERFLVLIYAVISCVSISAFDPLVVFL